MKGKYGRSTPYYRNVLPEMCVLEENVGLGDFTNNSDETGYADLDTKLPAGAIPIAWKAKVHTAFKATAAYTVVLGTTVAFVDGGAGADSITDSAAHFIVDGFAAGDSVTVAGATTAGNNKTYTIVTLDNNTLNLATGSVVAAEAGVTGMTFTGISTATIQVGVSGTIGKYSADTAQSVATIGSVGSAVPVAEACDNIGSDTTLRVTVSEGTDFDELDTGLMTLSVYYIKTS